MGVGRWALGAGRWALGEAAQQLFGGIRLITRAGFAPTSPFGEYNSFRLSRFIARRLQRYQVGESRFQLHLLHHRTCRSAFGGSRRACEALMVSEQAQEPELPQHRGRDGRVMYSPPHFTTAPGPPKADARARVSSRPRRRNSWSRIRGRFHCRHTNPASLEAFLHQMRV